jgi:hypothetical protein
MTIYNRGIGILELRILTIMLEQKHNEKSKMPTYPIILIPDRIQRAQNAEPSVPPFAGIAPSKPTAPPQVYNKEDLKLWGIIGFLVSLVLFLINGGLGISALLVSAGVIVYLAWSMNQSFPKRLLEYENYVREYPNLLQEYQCQEKDYQKEITRIRSPANVAQYRQDELLKALKQTTPNDGRNSNAKRGYLEPKLEKYLRLYFEKYIQTGLTIQERKYTISPDFAYIDSHTSLYIDIELDEPYDYYSGTPIHYVGIDGWRNSVVESRGWCVIRFAEEQVARQPDECCKEIAKFIFHILGDATILKSFTYVGDIIPIEQWTEAEAAAMAAQNYRQNYNNVNLLNEENENVGKSFSDLLKLARNSNNGRKIQSNFEFRLPSERKENVSKVSSELLKSIKNGNKAHKPYKNRLIDAVARGSWDQEAEDILHAIAMRGTNPKYTIKNHEVFLDLLAQSKIRRIESDF